MSVSEPCPFCRMPVPETRSTCPMCGHDLAASRAAKRREEEAPENKPMDPAASDSRDERDDVVPAAGREDSTSSALSRRRRVPAIAVVALVVILLLGVGTAAAFTVPVVSVTADKPLARLLPASTVLYIAADLNPRGQTKKTLDSLMRRFTGQAAWKNLESTLNSGTHSSAPTGTCYDQTSSQAFQHLDWLGHESAVALIGAQGLKGTTGANPGGISGGLKKNLIFLAPLQMHETLAGALSGFHLSLPSAGTSYNGTTIYKEAFSSCGQVSQGAANVVYAALDHGYILLGLQPEPIERIVDTTAGKITSLSTSASYMHLLSQLPGNRLASYYINGPALQKAGLATTARSLPAGSFLPTQSLNGVTGLSAGALTVEPDGFRFTMLGGTGHSSSAAHVVSGALAGKLASNTLALLSVGTIADSIRSAVRSYKQSGLLTGATAQEADAFVTDITDVMAGEVDVVLFHPQTKLNFTFGDPKFYVPAAIVWRAKDDFQAADGLDRFVRATKQSSLFTLKSTSNADYEAANGGYGYAVKDSWAMVSLSIAQTLDDLSATPPTTMADSPFFKSVEGPGSPPTSIWYVDIAGLRTQIEQSLVPSLPAGDGRLYRQNVQPLLAPLTTLTGSTSTDSHGKMGRSTVFLGVK